VKRIDVELGAHGYAVDIAAGLLDRAGEWLAPLLARPRTFIVTDTNVAAAQLPRLVRVLESAGIAFAVRVLPAGEASKSWSELAATVDWLVAEGCERGDTVVALGGGVVGDLAGFAAAIVKRGCAYVQIPTSLLAQVDSSVGGKTAINLAAGKNLAGAFHQPAAVLIDPSTLATLPDRHMRAGYSEIVKYGLIDDADFFAWCERSGAAVIARNAEALAHAIGHCIAAKARIVGADERETSGVRALLNLGHSFAHALEAEAGMGEALLHGEAVAVGMTLAFALSAERGLCTSADPDRVAAHLADVGLPVRVAGSASGSALARTMMADKKSVDGRLTLILAEGIGKAIAVPGFGESEIAAFIDRWQAR